MATAVPIYYKYKGQIQSCQGLQIIKPAGVKIPAGYFFIHKEVVYMESKRLNRMYDDVIALQKELEYAIDIKALAATYQLQDYLAFAVETARTDRFKPFE